MKFKVGDAVRYRPGYGTYGYEDCLGEDGRVAGIVCGHTPTRVRVELTIDLRRIGGRVRTERRAVDPASLILAPASIDVDSTP